MPVIACPQCGTKLNAPDSALGQPVVCGRCQTTFVAQASAPAPPAAQPQATQPVAPAGAAAGLGRIEAARAPAGPVPVEQPAAPATFSGLGVPLPSARAQPPFASQAGRAEMAEWVPPGPQVVAPPYVAPPARQVPPPASVAYAAVPGYPVVMAPAQKTSGFAIAALVLGIASLVTCACTYGISSIICGILAVVFYGNAMRDIAAGRAGGSSKSLANAGRITGLIGLFLGIGIVILVVVLIVVGQLR